MNWNSYADANLRDSTKVYEEEYASSWSNGMTPTAIEKYKEKARPINIENSNLYNIT